MEGIIYIAIFFIISVTAIDAMFATATSFNRARQIRALSAAGENAMERMLRDIRYSSAIDSSSTFDANIASGGGSLILASYDPTADVDQEVVFSVASGVLEVSEDGGTPEAITPEGVVVEDITFRRITTLHAPAIKIELTISGMHFYSTATLRRAYD